MKEAEPFRAYMLEQRAAIVPALARDMAARVELMARLPEEELQSSVEGILDKFLVALERGRTDELTRWSRERVLLRALQGFELEDMLEGLAVTRDHLLRAARAAAEGGIEGVWEGISIFLAVGDEIAASFTAFFHGKLEEAYAASARSEQRYRALYERTPVMMHSIDAEGRLITVSDLWLAKMGYTREEVLGRKSTELLTEESRRFAVEHVLPEFFRTGSLRDAPYRFVKKSGEIMDVLLSATSEKDEEGRVLRSLAVLIDVTEQVKIERELREGEERYRRLVEMAPIAFGLHQRGMIKYLNPAGLKMMGATSPEQIIGKPALEFVHPDSRATVTARMRRMLETGEAEAMVEEKWLRLDGSTMEVETTATPIPYEGGGGIQVVFLDISARKRADEAQRQSALQQEIIRAHEEALRALSTPLIPVSRGVLVMPLVGKIDEVRAAQILEALLAGVTAHRASFAIVDVTGVPGIDKAVADALSRTAGAVRLLGAEVVLTGVQSRVARALIELGASLSGIATRGTLEDGIAYATASASDPGQR